MRGDQCRRAIVQGRHDTSPDPTTEALDQLRLRYELAVSTAQRYRRAGFTAVVQDTIVGPMLAEFVTMIQDRPFSLIVLCPEPDEVAQRKKNRPKVGYGSFTAEQLDGVLRADTPRLGYWLDSTRQTVSETVDEVLANLDGAARID